jgi:hypothetical protein
MNVSHLLFNNNFHTHHCKFLVTMNIAEEEEFAAFFFISNCILSLFVISFSI